jgi:hypothetical protein
MLTALLGGTISSILSPIPPNLRTINFSIGRYIQHAFNQGNCWMCDTALTIDNNESDTIFEDIISHILSQDNVMLSVKSSESKFVRMYDSSNTLIQERRLA